MGSAYPSYLESYKNITPVSHKVGQGLSRVADHSKAENASGVTLPSLRPSSFSCISLIFFFFFLVKRNRQEEFSQIIHWSL